jgi:hypothetical protein
VPIPASLDPGRPTKTPDHRVPITAGVAHHLSDTCRTSPDGAHASASDVCRIALYKIKARRLRRRPACGRRFAPSSAA